MVVVESDLTYGQARGIEQADVDKYETKTGNFGGGDYEYGEGNRRIGYDINRGDTRARAFNDAYNDRMKLHGDNRRATSNRTKGKGC